MSVKDLKQILFDSSQNYTGFGLEDHSIEKKLLNLKNTVTDKGLISNIDAECLIYAYSIEKGVLIPKFNATGINGGIISYPNFENFDMDKFNYLKFRSENVSNLYQVAKYNHTLWLSPKRSQLFAKKAIEAYLSIFYEIIHDDEIETFDKISLLKNAIVLSFQSNYQVDGLKAILHKILYQDGFWKYGWQVTLLKFMLDQKKFKKENFENSIKLIESINQKLDEDADYFTIHDNLEVAIRISQKFKWFQNELISQLAQSCENIAETKHDNNSQMVAMMYLAEALSHYEKLKDTVSSERVSIKMVELKKSNELANISLPIDGLEKFVGPYKSSAFKLLEKSSIIVFRYLSVHNNLVFPDINKLITSLNNKKPSLLDLFRHVHYDINGNVSLPEQNEEDKLKRKINSQYSLHVQTSTILFLLPLFDEGIKRGVLNYNSLQSYLKEHTWLGEPLFRNRNGDKEAFTWLEMISPAILDFFNQFQLMHLTGQSNFTLTIDSLTLKFEGILRDFANLLGVKTLTASKKGNQKMVREMYIEDLLANATIQEYFDEHDRAFFNYLFLNSGLNLRNNVAHSFYLPSDYTFKKALLLILAILRLSKYTFSNKT